MTHPIKEYTTDEILAVIKEWGGVDDTAQALPWLRGVMRQMNRWLQRGDGIAVYENHDLGHRDIGDKRFTSYGSPAAQLETDTPPSTLPDGVGNTINWRYALIGTYRGDALNLDNDETEGE